MAGNLDKALLQMAGFEPEGDLYAKAADMWSGDEAKGYLGKTGYDFGIEKDTKDDAANWGFKDSDARLNALLYAWSKDNPNTQITPEVITRLRNLANTADSMNVTGGWFINKVYEDPHVTGLLKLIEKDPVKANNIFKAQGYNNNNSAIQNYFDWAGQYMDSDTDANNIFKRNILGKHFNESVRAGSHKLEDALNTAINTPTSGEIARGNIMKDIKNITREKAAEERRRRAWSNAGLGSLEDEDDDSIYPDEWL